MTRDKHWDKRQTTWPGKLTQTVQQTTGHGHTKKNKHKKRIIVANLWANNRKCAIDIHVMWHKEVFRKTISHTKILLASEVICEILLWPNRISFSANFRLKRATNKFTAATAAAAAIPATDRALFASSSVAWIREVILRCIRFLNRKQYDWWGWEWK